MNPIKPTNPTNPINSMEPIHQLLIIDPQNDFCDIPHAALPVSGAMADMERIADLITQCRAVLGSITVTLDSHPSLAIERAGFWLTHSGEAVAPFTVINHAAVQAGQFQPRQPQHREYVLHYLQALEAGGKYQLMIWPAHCIVGTWGHAMPAVVSDALYQWELATQTPVRKALKGLNPLTEQYSAIRAEVPLPDDAQTHTNQALVDSVVPPENGYLLVTGEASSHCVRATLFDILPSIPPERMGQVVVVTDCMSPVTGFEAQTAQFFADCRNLGIQTLTAAQTKELIHAHY